MTKKRQAFEASFMISLCLLVTLTVFDVLCDLPVVSGPQSLLGVEDRQDLLEKAKRTKNPSFLNPEANAD